ncbi:mucolipin-2-like isoform X1 [Sycon ciliatum]|uniref:mucolipin-2-like isoform X1 n=2 Tax=Sycon ciliatum TaxID=27933 RepID=UPI0031F6AB06
MASVLRSYGSIDDTPAVTNSINGDAPPGSKTNDERAPFLPQAPRSRKPMTRRSSSSSAREWVGNLFTRITSRNGDNASDQATDSSGNQFKGSADCECGLPDNEPFLRRLRRRNTVTERQRSKQGTVAPEVELRALRSRLSFHFSDFHRKYMEHKKKPWKFVLQILKIIFVSVQIGVFANSKAGIVTFLEDNDQAMNHMFVGNYTDLFTVEDVHNRLVNLLDNYYHIQHRFIGAYDYAWRNGSVPPLEVCVTYYKQGRVFAFNQSYIWDRDTVYDCSALSNASQANNTKWIEETFTSTTFDRIVRISSTMRFTTLFLNSYSEPACVALDVAMTMDNTDHAGRMPMNVEVTSTFLACHGNKVKTLSEVDFVLFITLDLVIVVLTTLAIVLTMRSLINTARLARRISKFLRTYSKHHLSAKEIFRLFDFWHIIAVVADALVITGTLLKLAVELKGDVATRNESEHFTVCSFLLGVGCLLIWVGALRFLSYFHGYNVLLVTLRCALPSLMRFMLCSGILYMAFAFCGWIALGTYHVKFRSLTVTSETLYSLLNGDDMYRTFELMPKKPIGPYIFSQVYLYIFISLFIYFVLSQFIALITETYTEVLKMKEEDYEHLNACGHILRLLEVDIDGSNADIDAMFARGDDSLCPSPTEDTGIGIVSGAATTPPQTPLPASTPGTAYHSRSSSSSDGTPTPRSLPKTSPVDGMAVRGSADPAAASPASTHARPASADSSAPVATSRSRAAKAGSSPAKLPKAQDSSASTSSARVLNKSSTVLIPQQVPTNTESSAMVATSVSLSLIRHATPEHSSSQGKTKSTQQHKVHDLTEIPARK